MFKDGPVVCLERGTEQFKTLERVPVFVLLEKSHRNQGEALFTSCKGK